MELFMEILGIILIILAIVLVITICVGAYAFSDKTNHRYCKVFDRKQLNLWEHMHANVFNFKYAYTFKGNRYFVWENYEAIIWEYDGLTSVHDCSDNKKCILCTFDTKYSGKMGALLLNCVGVPEDEKDLYDPDIY
jgi:hypothetical protein